MLSLSWATTAAASPFSFHYILLPSFELRMSLLLLLGSKNVQGSDRQSSCIQLFQVLTLISGWTSGQ